MTPERIARLAAEIKFYINDELHDTGFDEAKEILTRPFELGIMDLIYEAHDLTVPEVKKTLAELDETPETCPAHPMTIGRYLDNSPLLISLDADTEGESNPHNWPIESHCGQECKKIIDATVEFLKLLDPHPSVVRPIEEGAKAAMEVICFG